MSRPLVLTGLWWGWGLLLIVLMILMVNNASLFGGDSKAAWDWFVPNIVPTLTLVGAAAYRGNAPASDGEKPVLLFVLTLVVSALYLAILTYTLASTLYSVTPLKSLQSASLYLGVLQGMVTSFLGLFFIKK